MIGRLQGLLAIKRPPKILLDCQGVGYEVEVSMSTFYQLPAEGDKVSIWTHLLIKDDQHALVGFYTEQERSLFRELIKVNGVGPKMALTILSGIAESDFALCVQTGDVATLTRLPGVGKKTAERLIIEMRDKLQQVDTSATATGSVFAGSAATTASAQSEAVEALQSLGYKPADAVRMIKTALVDDADAAAEQLIKSALQQAVSR
jgi:Holliday junction DNA helicase RuvA